MQISFSFKVIVEIVQLFPYISSYQIRLDLLKRFMVITYIYINHLKNSNSPYSVETSCLTSLLDIRASVIGSDTPQTKMDELSQHCYHLMKHVSFC